jgi:ComF family protein
MLLDLVFPRRCLGCGQWGGYFCPECQKTIRFLGTQICPECQKPAMAGKAHLGCQTKFSLNGLTCLFPYRGPVKKAIKKLKYRYVTDLAETLIELVAVKKKSLLKKNQVLIPVPLHARKKKQRGFNQAELLGKLLANKFGWQFEPDLLVRQRFTQSQTKLKGQERRANVKNAFRVKKSIPKPSQSYVLFDDVWTTGSTLKEAASTLKKAGSKRIWGLTLAR